MVPDADAKKTDNKKAATPPTEPPKSDPPVADPVSHSSAPPTTPSTVPPEPVVGMGAAAYDRILELLEGVHPLPDNATVPEGFGEGVPADLKDWLKAFRAPLVHLTVETVLAAVQSRITGTDRGRLKQLYQSMTPVEIAAVMAENVKVIDRFTTERAREAAVIASLRTRVSETATRFLITALTLV